jgi:uncharacterized membrane protein YphA (DoxX/SURF4 family)
LLASSTLPDVARIILGGALLVAAVTKIGAGTLWVKQAVGLAVPRPVAVSVPWVELAVGASVAVGLAEPWSAAAAVVLLVVFTAWIVVRLARGQHEPCACFGSLSASPLSWWQVVRNCVLIALGIIALIP